MADPRECIEAAREQLVLVEGVLLEARDLNDRINKGLQALANAKGELAVAKDAIEGGG